MASVLHRITKEYHVSANTPDFPLASWIHNPDLSAVQGVERRYWKILGDTVSEMTSAEKDTAELANRQAELVKDIDLVCESNIHDGVGFEWPPASGKFFSLTSNAQVKWVGLYAGRSDPNVTYPITVQTKDDQNEYAIADATEVANMYLTAFGTVRAELDLATAAKQNVRNATTIATAETAAVAYTG